jgi:hypothetical protein
MPALQRAGARRGCRRDRPALPPCSHAGARAGVERHVAFHASGAEARGLPPSRRPQSPSTFTPPGSMLGSRAGRRSTRISAAPFFLAPKLPGASTRPIPVFHRTLTTTRRRARSRPSQTVLSTGRRAAPSRSQSMRAPTSPLRTSSTSMNPAQGRRSRHLHSHHRHSLLPRRPWAGWTSLATAGVSGPRWSWVMTASGTVSRAATATRKST